MGAVVLMIALASTLLDEPIIARPLERCSRGLPSRAILPG